MAFPSIQATSTTNGTTAATSCTVNLPTTVADDAGKTLISIHRAALGGTISWPAGWTEVFEDGSDASDDSTAWAWKKCAGAEGATMTVTQGTNAKFANICFLVAGAEDPTTRAPESGTIGTGTSSNPDPGDTTPTGGAKDYLWLAIGAYDNEATNPPSVFPANYGLNNISADSGTAGLTTTNCRVSGCGRQLNASSQDPGTYTISVSSNWTGFTIALHPAPPMYEDEEQVEAAIFVRPIPDERIVMIYQ